MPEVEEVFRMATNKVKPDPDALQRQQRRQRLAARQGRVRAYVAVAAVLALIAVGAVAAFDLRARDRETAERTSVVTQQLTLATQRAVGTVRQVPAVVDLHGHQTSTIQGFSTDGFAASVSEDGSTIAYIAAPVGLGYTQAVVMDADGSNRRVIATPGLDVSGVALSPDGTQLAIASDIGGSDIYVLNVDGTGLRQLTTDSGTDQYPQWSPDGSTIVYDNTGRREYQTDVQFSETAEIWSVQADGSAAPVRLTHNHVPDNAPSFSPDGRRIAYFHAGELWTMAPDGADQQLLTPNGGFTPRWSPDGRTIAATYYVDTSKPLVEFGGDVSQRPLCIVRLIDARTGEITNLRNVGMATDTNTPQWIDPNHLLVLRVPVNG
jgi:dipeptidyl aminopeptidase/acylaminoacyl peptidase